MYASQSNDRRDPSTGAGSAVAAGDDVDRDRLALLVPLVTSCMELGAFGAVGVLLADEHGQLQLAACSSGEAWLLQLHRMQVDRDDGPCIDSYRTGAVVSCEDLHRLPSRWPAFAELAVARGFGSVTALPLRLASVTFGVLSIFDRRRGPLSAGDLALVAALGDIATVGLLHHRSAQRSRLLAEHLQRALDSRVVIEQAKGFLAATLDAGVDDAFTALRSYARRRNLKLADVAAGVVQGRVTAADLLGPTRREFG